MASIGTISEELATIVTRELNSMQRFSREESWNPGIRFETVASQLQLTQ